MTTRPRVRPSVTRHATLLVALALAVMAAACVDGEDAGDDAGPEEDPAPTSAPAASGGSDDGIAAFCAEMERLDGERPESYVGSAEHLEDLNDLVAVAPDDVRAEAEAYRDFIGTGVVNPDDPDSNLTENFPADVQEAIAEIMALESDHC